MKKIVALVMAMVMVLGLATTAFAADDYKLYENKVNPATATDIDEDVVSVFTKVPAAAPKMGDNGTTWVAGNIEYYVAKDVDGNDLFFYEVNDKDDATYVIKNGKVAYKYVVVMDSADEAFYYAKATKSNNTAMNDSECGKVDISDWKKTDVLLTFADEEGTVVYAKKVAQGAGDVDVLYDGVIVGADVVDVNKHTFYPTYTEGDISGAACGKCNVPVYRVKSAASLPTTAVVIETVQCTGAYEGQILYWNAPAASTGSAAADSAVESPKTFDAGIAMYVGMSVMAAAGSAVVLKKKD